MITAVFLMHFFLCGPTEMFCEEGRMTHHSCAAAEAWLRAGMRPDQVLLVSACETIEQQNPITAAARPEEPRQPQIVARKLAKGSE
ncbi:MAG: hypothetical protein ING02_16000 [Roseomonas sp.]|nr:hypothetical protein [Roseomonas sp.]